MSLIARRTAASMLRPSSMALRYLSTPTPPSTPSSHSASTSAEASSSKPVQDDKPYPVGPTIFPAPNDPFAPIEPPKPESERPKYSETQRKVVMGIARMMGYNSRATTAIRETRRMMKGIVDAIERDHEYWYEECRLSPTFQTFFQLHLLYVLILIPRLRALPASAPSHSHPIPEHGTPDEPTHTPPSNTSSIPSLLYKPLYESYVAELVNHFFELTESQMRRVLGRGERERIVKKYMSEMAEQWHGAGAGLDYALGLQASQNPEEHNRADAEVVSWLWRNLFASRGLGAPAPGLIDPSMRDEFGLKEVEMPEQLDKSLRFLRREMARLDKVSHRDVIDGNIGQWGPIATA